MKTLRLCTLALAAAPSLILAVETRSWTQGAASDYEKAEVKRLSIRSDGRITLAPVFEEVFDSSAPYLWALAEDSKGNLYTGGGGASGSKTRLTRIDAKGKSSVYAELEGLEIHAIAIDAKDRVYAATVPDAKIWRIASAGKAELFYDTKAKYVWAMSFDSAGNLLVATGDSGEIHKVTPAGKGSVFARTGELHVRSMALDAKGNIIAGTEPGGLIMRITPGGESFVLHQASKREVTAVAVAADGSIYAAAVGAKQPVMAPMVQPVQQPQPAQANAQAQQAARQQQATPPPTMMPTPTAVMGGSELWRIATDGYPRKVWADAQDVAYALAFDGAGNVLVATGNRGRIYRIEAYPLATQLVSAAPTQVLTLAQGRNGRVWAATGNIGKVFRLGPELAADGVLESEPFDAGAFSYWGRWTWHGKANGGVVAAESHSGNLDRPQKHWSPWEAIALNGDGGRITAPAARFLQYRLTLKASSGGKSPFVDSVDAAYQSKNVAPEIEQMEATPANYRFPQQMLNITPTGTITLPPIGRKRGSSSSVAISSEGSSQTLTYAKGQVGVRWAASDANGDTLQFKLEIRGVNENDWKPLKDKLRERFYSWDSAPYADGEYQVRLTATDSPSNPPASALTAGMVSDPFTIDNTPPVISALTNKQEGADTVVSWHAKDALNNLDKAEYSLDGGDWMVVEPVTRLTDAPELDYAVRLANLPAGEHVIAIRVSDEFDNQATAKLVIKR